MSVRRDGAKFLREKDFAGKMVHMRCESNISQFMTDYAVGVLLRYVLIDRKEKSWMHGILLLLRKNSRKYLIKKLV